MVAFWSIRIHGTDDRLAIGGGKHSASLARARISSPLS